MIERERERESCAQCFLMTSIYKVSKRVMCKVFITLTSVLCMENKIQKTVTSSLPLSLPVCNVMRSLFST